MTDGIKHKKKMCGVNQYRYEKILKNQKLNNKKSKITKSKTKKIK